MSTEDEDPKHCQNDTLSTDGGDTGGPAPVPHDRGAPLTREQRISFARSYYESIGYRVHSGLQFGCELVLYADCPSRVHSDFCVHVLDGPDGRVDWRRIQTLVRSMPDLHKTLILAHVRKKQESIESEGGGVFINTEEDRDTSHPDLVKYEVTELAFATEHAPFRHKYATRKLVEVGSQVKREGKRRRSSPDNKKSC